MDPEEGVAGPHLAAKIIGAEETGGTGTEAPAVTTGEIGDSCTGKIETVVTLVTLVVPLFPRLDEGRRRTSDSIVGYIDVIGGNINAFKLFVHIAIS
jgi:hypothetical protein